MQQNLQQTCTFRLLLGYCCASVSIISLYLAIVNHLFTNTYKNLERIRNPLLYPTELRAQHLIRQEVTKNSIKAKFPDYNRIVVYDMVVLFDFMVVVKDTNHGKIQS
ncbi:hypothetical protein ES703_49514 [subsurface metagenome]